VAVAARHTIHYYTLRGGSIQYISTYMVAESTGTEWRPLFSVRVTEEAVAGVRRSGMVESGEEKRKKAPRKNWC